MKLDGSHRKALAKLKETGGFDLGGSMHHGVTVHTLGNLIALELVEIKQGKYRLTELGRQYAH